MRRVQRTGVGRWAALAVGVALFWGMPGARAQVAEPDSVGALQEVVVTATKRASTVQDTPISITAITGEELQARGITEFAAIVQSVPGLSMRTSGPGQTEIEMRGMTSAGGNSSTVGFYLDDTPLTAPANSQNGKVVIDPNLYDLNRVEVLRGPQGTLYGAGSMGGTIKLVPNLPDPAHFDASAEVVPSYSEGGGFNHAENAMANLPLGSTAAVRLVGSAAHDSGWIDRVVIAEPDFPLESSDKMTRGNVLAAPVSQVFHDVNDTSKYSARVSLLWKPTDRFSIQPFLMYARTYQDGLSQIDSNPGTDAHYAPFDTPEGYSDRFTLGSLNLTYAFDRFELTSTTSRWTRQAKLEQDGVEQFQWAFSAPYALFPFYSSQGGLGNQVPTGFEDDSSSQTSEEVRITSSGNTRFKWLAGFFYSDFESCYCSEVLFPDAAALFGTANAFTQYQTTKIRQNSLFMDLSYEIIPHLTASAGLRRYSYKNEVDAQTSGFVSITGSDEFVSSVSPENNQGINPKFGLSYQVDHDLLVYGTVAKGFRPGGGNQPIPTSGPLGDVCEANLQENHGTTEFVPAPLSYGPDTVWSYELGEKWRTASSRLTLNGAVYFEKWAGTQQNVPLPCGYPYTANAGTAHIYGVEMELNALLAPGLVFSLNGAYTHATFAVGSLEAGIEEGTRVQDVPEHTMTAALAYHHPFNEHLGFVGRVEDSYVGERTDVTYAVNTVPSYNLTNVRAGVEAEHWSAVVFVHNAANQRAILTNAFQLNINIPTYNRMVVAQPLTVGLDLAYHF